MIDRPRVGRRDITERLLTTAHCRVTTTLYERDVLRERSVDGSKYVHISTYPGVLDYLDVFICFIQYPAEHLRDTEQGSRDWVPVTYSKFTSSITIST
jgi:hypothetical protein